MTMPTADTAVTYPAGALTGAGTVLHTETLPDGRLAVLVDATPVHPVDAGWPDQGPDRATLTTPEGTEVPVADCIVGATDGSTLFLGRDIPVRKGTEGWAFTVVHILPAGTVLAEGAEVRFRVDEGYRAGISAGHTACHLASLALNRQLAHGWKKDVQPDAAGNPNFDALAVETTAIREFGSRDVYRLGKSLRRKGFQSEALLADLAAVEAGVNAALAAWTASGAKVRIDRESELLTGMRRWVCELPDGTVSMPCGGTHLSSLADISGISVRLTSETLDGAVEVVMNTYVSA
ncbi:MULTISPECIES: metal-dependent hydrolase [unclassified Arthrobacter]|uniref:metal-dependent hydrolase n=1 Tax=unclassified Arthrobacter TaxID=235627 RepID=UPI001D14FA15|nr:MULTISPECIES: metal-dependent hydrolase [unclassified Arthrobacter]MCC3275492.1 metal-dependent hydrolase [Arthrobacter sp. zg-Y20]MCC9176933.1 metal-dependent hydrolase [Arthrobacter sp. zg-Y750]MDK1315649.1 metal-dependent hydrolase [Arthrobacter sp. zg.Y20]WIB06059.1 metal-dependent hydrolase [Arthrobacter sp. zg-Y20]